MAKKIRILTPTACCGIQDGGNNGGGDDNNPDKPGGEDNPTPTPTKYTLVVKVPASVSKVVLTGAVNETITKSTTYSLEEGSVVNYTYYAKDGYTFGNPSDATRQETFSSVITMDSNKEITKEASLWTGGTDNPDPTDPENPGGGDDGGDGDDNKDDEGGDGEDDGGDDEEDDDAPFDYTDPPTGTTVITLDQTESDPYKMLSGDFGKDGDPKTNVISWIRANSHRYVGTYSAAKGMQLKQLMDVNGTQYIDSNNANNDLKTKDVFMKMPTFWFKGVEKGSEDIVEIHFTAKNPKDESWTKWDGKTLIGVYEGSSEGSYIEGEGILYSRTGHSIVSSRSYDELKGRARERSNGDDHFMLVTYEAHQVMSLLYMAYYGNTNGRLQCGYGKTTTPVDPGATNFLGMTDTTPDNGDEDSINFWGLENWWNGCAEFIDNLEIIDEKNSIKIMDYNGNTVRTSTDNTNKQFTVLLRLTSKLDVIFKKTDNLIEDLGPTELGPEYFSYYYTVEGAFTSKPGNIALRGGFETTACGPLWLRLQDRTNTSGYYGSRILYHGKVIPMQ